MAADLNIAADAAAAYLKRSSWRPLPEGEALREFLDGWTQSDLDYLQLNILTDMVAKRLTTPIGRPTGSNADEWHSFLCHHLDNRATSPNGLTYVAMQIAEAIDAAMVRP